MERIWMPNEISEGRLAEFRAALIDNNLNAYKAAIAIGISKKSAKANSYLWARRCNLKMSEALRAKGLDEASQADKLLMLRDAATRIVSDPEGDGEVMEVPDYRVQLEATKEINKILGAYPAEPPKLDAITLNVSIDMPGVL